MNTMDVAPEVRDFVAAVRMQLVDLDPDERAEITDGLEADLAELLAERGPGALGDPIAYAVELRAAAGLGPLGAARGGRRGFGEAVTGVLDAAHQRFDALVARAPRDLRPLIAWLRPLWWVARAWIAVQVGVWGLSAFFGIGYYESYWTLVPTGTAIGWIVLGAAVLGSVQMGRGRLWPGGRRGPAARTILLGLNVLAILLVPVSLAMVRNQSEVYWNAYNDGYAAAQRDGGTYDDGYYGIDEQAGIYSGGRWVTNVYPYDASGRPLVGVQLFDQLGNPISVVAAPECPDGSGWTVYDENDQCWDEDTGDPAQGRVPYPWTNGATQVENVFPLPTRMQDDLGRSATAFAEAVPPAIGEFPLASVPPVSLPGIVASVVAEPAAAPAADTAAGGRKRDR